MDLLVGRIDPETVAAAGNFDPSTRVAMRSAKADWSRDGEILTLTSELSNVRNALYVRVRGTATDELEPELDVIDEDPWQDLWFYSNPVFVLVGS